MNIEKESRKELLIFFIIIILSILSPLIIPKGIWIYEEYDGYKYICTDALGERYIVEHINKGFRGTDTIKLNDEIITIIKYKRVKK